VQKSFVHIFNRKKFLQISLHHPLIPFAQCQKKLHTDKLHLLPEEDITITMTEEVVTIVGEVDIIVVAEEEIPEVMQEDNHFKGMLDIGAEDHKGEDILCNREWECLSLLMLV
jgi:hypothetical protein